MSWVLGLEAFTAYDCTGRPGTDLQVTAIDTLAIGDCEAPESTYFQTEQDPSRDVQVIFSGSRNYVDATVCSVVYSKTVVRCGFDSITYASVDIADDQRYELTGVECARMAKQGEITLFGKRLIVKPNHVTRGNFFTYGKVRPNGKCQTAAEFVSEGMTFYGSYEQVKLTVTLTTTSGVYNSLTGLISFPNLQNRRAEYTDMQLVDDQVGTVTWNREEEQCKDRYSEVYSGLAALHRHKANTKGNVTFENWKEIATNSIVLIERRKTRQYGGLVIKGPLNICGKQCYSTQIDDMAICMIDATEEKLSGLTHRFNPREADLVSQMNFLSIHDKLATGDRLREIAMQMCQLERRILFNEVQAVVDGNRNSLNEHIGRGSVVILRGAVLYVKKCRAVEVVNTPHRNCTLEIPVKLQSDLNGTMLFADPRTHILQPIPTIVPCSDAIPVKWFINGIWKCSTPDVVVCGQPDKLNATKIGKWTLFPHVADGHGLFDDSYVQGFTRALEAGQSQEAVTSTLANEAVASRGPDGQIVNVIPDPMKVEWLPFFNPLFQLCWWMGSGFQIIIATFVIADVIRIILSTMVRLCVLLWERGVGMHLFYALFDSFWAIARSPAKLIVSAAEQVIAPVQWDSEKGEKVDVDDKERTDELRQPSRLQRYFPSLGDHHSVPRHPLVVEAERRARESRPMSRVVRRVRAFSHGLRQSVPRALSPVERPNEVYPDLRETRPPTPFPERSAASFPDDDPYDGTAPHEVTVSREDQEEYVVRFQGPSTDKPVVTSRKPKDK